MGFKKSLVIVFILSLSIKVDAQVKKPTLMILPSDNWCIQRYFYKEINSQGNIIKLPDYKKVFQEDQEIAQVISKIGSLMIDAGYPLKDAETEIKSFERQNTIDEVISNSSGGNNLNKTVLDQIISSSKSDILVQIWWQVNKKPNDINEIKFILEAIDTYTNKRISSSTGINDIKSNQSISEALYFSVQNNITLFIDQIQNHFDNLFKNGREVKIQIKVFKDWGNNLETEFQNKPLNEIIEQWLQENTVNSKYNISSFTENFMNIEEIRIPILDKNNKGVDARSFLRNLQNFLKNPIYSIPSKLISTGIGEATLIIGDK